MRKSELCSKLACYFFCLGFEAVLHLKLFFDSPQFSFAGRFVGNSNHFRQCINDRRWQRTISP